MLLYPVSVQGELAAPQMIAALRYFDKNKAADVIIIGRGGGSFEDLNCFNDEALARTVYECEIPIISAVGHETDFTICDFVADVREATPSTAAKRAVPQKTEELEKLNAAQHILTRRIVSLLEENAAKIARIDMRISRLNPQNMLIQTRQQLDMAHLKIASAMLSRIENAASEIKELKHTVETLNPKNTLKRGYAIIQDAGRRALTDKSALIEAHDIIINMHDGEVAAKVTEEEDA